jgi:pilus assembly protein CpaE
VTLIWTTEPGVADQLEYALGASGLASVSSGARVLRALEENPSHDLVVIAADVPLDEACALAEEQRVERPDLGVLLLRKRVDVSTLNQALRSGVRDVMDAEDSAALAAAARRSRDLTARLRGPHDQHGAGKVITVFSAKGGVGKTMLAVNLAAHLAATGAPTLLIDLDVMFGDVAISCQLNPPATLADAAGMAGHMDQQGLTSLVAEHGSGLHVLAAPSDPAEAEGVATALVAETIRVARTAYRYIVVDTPPNISEHVLTAFDTTDVALLIATLDIPAVKNLRIAISTLDTLGADQGGRLVVLNRASDKVGLSLDEVASALRTGVDHAIPSSLDVPVAANRGEPLTTSQPRHAVSLAVRDIADDVRKRLGERVEEPTKRRRLSWR